MHNDLLLDKCVRIEPYQCNHQRELQSKPRSTVFRVHFVVLSILLNVFHKGMSIFKYC